MKLEQQVCNLKLAKRLKKLGVQQDAFLVWDSTEEKICLRELYENHNYTSAFSVAEFGEMLVAERDVRTAYSAVAREYVVSVHDAHGVAVHQELAKTEAGTRAEMPIYLLENKLIQASE